MSNNMADRLVDDLSHLAARYACAPPVVDRPGAPISDGSVSSGKPDSKPPAGVDHPLQAALISFARRLIDAHQAAHDLNPPIDVWKPPPMLGWRHETTELRTRTVAAATLDEHCIRVLDDVPADSYWTPDPDDPSLDAPNAELITAVTDHLIRLVRWADTHGHPLDGIARQVGKATRALDRLNVGKLPDDYPTKRCEENDCLGEDGRPKPVRGNRSTCDACRQANARRRRKAKAAGR